MFRSLFAGISQRITLENSLQLQKAKLIRPPQIKLEVAQTLHAIDQQLEDKALKKVFDSIKIEVPA